MTKQELVTELSKFANVPNKFVANSIKNLIETIVEKDVDFKNQMMYINKWASKAKDRETIGAISEVIKLIRRYMHEKN